MDWRGWTRRGPGAWGAARALALAVGLLSWGTGLALGGDLYDAGSIVPTDVDLAVAVDDAGSWRGGPLGPGLTMLVGSAARSAGLDAAWGRLAQTLEMSEEEAFDALLGRRVVFAQRGAHGAGGVAADGGAGAVGGAGPSWTLVCEVETKTARLLTAKLNAAPRRFQDGSTAYALEGGRFWLALHESGDSWRVLLGPSAAPAVFEESLVALTAKRAGPAPPPGAVAELRLAEGRPSAWMTARVVSRDERDSGWMGVALRTDGDALHAVLKLRCGTIKRSATSVGVWSRGAFDEASRGSLVAIAEWAPPVGAVAGEDAAESAAMWSLWASAARLIPGIPFARDGSGVFGPRAMLLLGREEESAGSGGQGQPGHGPGALWCVAGLEAHDVASAALAGDGLVASLVLGLRGPGSDLAMEQEALDMGGAFASAVRSVRLGGAAGGMMGSLLGETSLAWTSRQSAEGAMATGAAAAAAAADADAPGAAGAGGWWIVGLGESRVSALARALESDGAGGEHAAWLSLGRVKPRAVALEIRDVGVPLSEVAERALGVLEMVDEASWEVRREENGSISGTARVMMAGGGGGGGPARGR